MSLPQKITKPSFPHIFILMIFQKLRVLGVEASRVVYFDQLSHVTEQIYLCNIKQKGH